MSKPSLINRSRRLFATAAFGLLALGANPAAVAQSTDTDAWGRVKASGVLTVAVYNFLEPFSHEGKGLDVDIARAVASKLGLGLRVRAFNEDEEFSDDLRSMVWMGHYLAGPPADVMMHVPIDQRLMQAENRVQFFAPYFREDYFVAYNTRKLGDINSLEPFAMDGNKIGVEVASLPSLVMSGADGRAYVNNTVNFKTPREAVAAMVKGELVAVMATRAELEWALSQHVDAKADYAIVRIANTQLPQQGWVVGMATKKGNEELARKLTEAMNQVKESGEMAELFKKYNVTYSKP